MTTTPQSYCREVMGFAVMPVGANKRPLGPWKHLQSQLPDPDEVRSYQGNYAIITGSVSGIVVVDVDSKEALEYAQANLPEPALKTITAKGEHWFYRHPGAEVPNKARIPINGTTMALDIRGDGGYVVGPNSVHETGHVYRPEGTWTPEALASGPAFDPAWIPAPPEPVYTRPEVPAIQSSQRILRAQAWLQQREPAVQGSGGDHWTYLTICNLLDFDLDDSEVLSLIEGWNATCLPPWGPKELRQKLENARKYGRGGYKGPDRVPELHPALTPTHVNGAAAPPPDQGGQGGCDWPEPLPLQGERPRFPTELLPDTFRAMVEEVARATQTPPAMAAMVGFSVLSLASLKKAHLRINETWVEDLPIYTVTTASPGTRKSPVFKAMMEEVLDWQAEELERAKKAELRNAELIKYYNDLIAKNRKEALRCEFSDGEVLVEQNSGLVEKVERLTQECRPKQLICDDATPESIAQAMGRNGGTIGNFSTEGDLMEIIAGKYSSNTNLSIVLKAYSGDAHYTNRIKREAESVAHPLMALGLMTQPEVLDSVRSNQKMRRQGLLARFLYADPDVEVGTRKGLPGPINSNVRNAWRGLLRRLIDLPSDNVPVRFSEEAFKLFCDYKDFIELRLRPAKGEMSDMADWGAKIVGTMGRLATILHLTENGIGGRISERTLTDCILLVEAFFIPHAAAMLGNQEASIMVENYRDILSNIPSDGASLRDLKKAYRRKAIDFDECLEDLASLHHVRFEKLDTGGRPSYIVTKNPLSDQFIEARIAARSSEKWHTIGLIQGENHFDLLQALCNSQSTNVEESFRVARLFPKSLGQKPQKVGGQTPFWGFWPKSGEFDGRFFRPGRPFGAFGQPLYIKGVLMISLSLSHFLLSPCPFCFVGQKPQKGQKPDDHTGSPIPEKVNPEEVDYDLF